jgi:hypothetical protein
MIFIHWNKLNTTTYLTSLKMVGWDVCCLPKNEGGLAIKRHRHMNDAFLMKMMWNLITKLNYLWCKVLYSKYGRNNDLRVTIKSQSYVSSLWKAL